MTTLVSGSGTLKSMGLHSDPGAARELELSVAGGGDGVSVGLAVWGLAGWVSPGSAGACAPPQLITIAKLAPHPHRQV
ncbi:MAG: hypothetical protein KC766_12535 [Myxococcales bacterium]|nr:hypothetical protein [Myxococcales bacterium]